MTPITCAKPSPPRGRSPSSPTTRHGRSNIRSTSISMPSAISSNAASRNSSSSDASQPASKRLPEITAPSSLSQPSFYGCDKCPHHLTLGDAQSLSRWWTSDQRREPPQVLSNGGQNKLVLSASRTTQSKPNGLPDRSTVRA